MIVLNVLPILVEVAVEIVCKSNKVSYLFKELYKMRLPNFTAEESLHKASNYFQGTVLKDTALSGSSITLSTLPTECINAGSQGYTDTTCYGVVLVCTDKCRVYDPTVPGFYREVSGAPYVCGACFGLPF
jgi:hypothetical protein